MVLRLSDDEQNIVFKCNECGEIFPREVVEELILKGKTAYCEKCGFPFKSEFTKKDYKKMGSPPIYEKSNVTYQTSDQKDKEQYKTRHELKHDLKHQLKHELRQERREIRRESRKRYDSKTQSESDSTPQDIKRVEYIWPRTNERTDSDRYRSYREKHQPVKVQEHQLMELKKAINILNTLVSSPLILIIGLIITIAQIPGAIYSSFPPGTIYKILLQFVMIVLLYTYSRQIVTSFISDGNFSKMGFDAILIGSIGLGLYGLGILVLAEGICILVYEILVQRNELIEHKLTKEFNYEILGANTLERAINVFNELSYKMTAFIVLFGSILIFNQDFILRWQTFFYAAFLVVSLVMLRYIKHTFQPHLNSIPYQKIDEDFLVKSTILAIFTLPYAGAGAPMLIICILIWTFKGMADDIKKRRKIQRPIKAEIPKQEVPEEKKELDQEITDVETTHPEAAPKSPEYPKSLVPFKEMQTTSDDTEKSKKKDLTIIPKIEIKTKKSEKKKPLQPIPKLSDEKLKKIEKDVKKQSEPFEKDPEKQAKIRVYLDRIFTVLSEDTRRRLMKLDIPEGQKWDIVKEFVNLKEEQQRKYLEELEDVNRKISQQLVQRIMKMNISDSEKQSLILELQKMTPESRENFVEFLESND